MAATGLAKVSELRRRVFELHSGGKVSGTVDRDKVYDVFKKWKKQMNDDRDIRMAGDQVLEGFLLPFEDHRDTTMMVASVTVPLSSDTV